MNSPPRVKPEKTSQVVCADVQSQGRRHFLRKGAAMAGTALAGGAGKPIPATEYGVPSKYEKNYVRVRTNVFVNRQNQSDWSFTPLQYQQGIVTPNGVIYERHHNGTPEINPDTHKLVIHGMVKQPLVFTMNDIMRYPSVSKFYFMECSGNGLTDWTKPASTTVQQTHGLLSCGQWVGVPFSTLLDEAGLAPGAKWLLVEGADGVGHTRSIPLQKAMIDGLLVYALNGEMLRPENDGRATSTSNGCAASRSAISRGIFAARPRATPTRCRRANGGSSAWRWTRNRLSLHRRADKSSRAPAPTKSGVSRGRDAARSRKSTCRWTAVKIGARPCWRSRCWTSA